MITPSSSSTSSLESDQMERAMDALLATGLKEGWYEPSPYSGVVAVGPLPSTPDPFADESSSEANEPAPILSEPSTSRTTLQAWGQLLSSRHTRECLFLSSSATVSHLFDAHIDADCTLLPLSRRRRDHLRVFATRTEAVAQLGDDETRFLVREGRVLGLLQPLRLVKSAAREIESRMVRFAAQKTGLEADGSASVARYSVAMPALPRSASMPFPLASPMSLPTPNGYPTYGTLPYSVSTPTGWPWPTTPLPTSSSDPFASSSVIHESAPSEPTEDQATVETATEPVETRAAPPVQHVDPETGRATLEPGRKVRLLSPMCTGAALGLNVFMISGLVQKIVVETLVDANLARLALLVAAPLLMMLSQFLWDNVVSFVAQMVFPIRQMHENSLYHSGTPSEPLPADYPLPSFTIQMPCYKESLRGVLAPSLESAQRAVEAYRALGGVANVLICEDGLRLLPREEAEERMQFYARHGFGWVARPKHGDGYIRKGRFKKASNLNFTYTLSLRIEAIMDSLRSERAAAAAATAANPENANDRQDDDDDEVEEELYRTAFARALDEREGQAWASGNIRIGDHILLIDSDTRMKPDCLIEAAAEMERCPEVGALQHCSGVMYVRSHYFERFVGYFTACCINFSISWNCANGAMAPLMGHNVFLRWRAMQEVSTAEADGELAVFSPYHVSEDFEMAIKLQIAGYIIRWATYSDQGFTEGVSFTPEDEVNRYQKYAFGCSEIVFNPLRQWLTRSPLSTVFRTFLFNDGVHTVAKVATLSYMSTYYALGIAFPLTLVMFVVQGLFQPWLDPVFLPNFDVWVTVTIVFMLPGLIIARARCGHTTFLGALRDTLTHLPATLVFFSGLGFHIFTALLAHLFGYNMVWTTTNKDFTETSFVGVVRQFWKIQLLCIAALVGIVVWTSDLIPLQWRMDVAWTIIIPPVLLLCLHMLFPIVLDPGLLHKFLPSLTNPDNVEILNRGKAFFSAAGDRLKVNYSNTRAARMLFRPSPTAEAAKAREKPLALQQEVEGWA